MVAAKYQSITGGKILKKKKKKLTATSRKSSNMFQVTNKS
jgi:hypothetical protein